MEKNTDTDNKVIRSPRESQSDNLLFPFYLKS